MNLNRPKDVWTYFLTLYPLQIKVIYVCMWYMYYVQSFLVHVILIFHNPILNLNGYLQKRMHGILRMFKNIAEISNFENSHNIFNFWTNRWPLHLIRVKMSLKILYLSTSWFWTSFSFFFLLFFNFQHLTLNQSNQRVATSL